MAKCAVCLNEVDAANASVLTMSGYGYPRFICEDCERDIELATKSRDYSEACAAMERLSDRLTSINADKQTMMTMTELLADAALRAKAIKDGTYDFSLDEEEEVLEDIPEELRETEEDIAATASEEEKLKKFDKVFGWVSGVILAICGAILIWRLLDIFVF